jgi:glycosyltransferase involved in cell wall biosynthesis
MHVLFVHQNFPAQFRYLAPRLVNEFGWQCTFCTERVEGDLPNVRKLLYKPRGGATLSNSVLTRNFENSVAHAHGVFDALKATPDIQPDLVVAHCGFGSSLFLPLLYDAPIINFLEFYYSPVGQDLGFRPEVPVGEMELLRSKTNNAMILLDVMNCDKGWTPTHYQRAFFPEQLRGKIEAIFDGIDTSVYHRKEGARQRVCEKWKVDPSHKIVSYVARGFEMMRGFDIFMKAAKEICQKRQDVTLLVVGTDKVHYGSDLKYIEADTFRHEILGQGEYDLKRFRFTGYLPQDQLADILSATDVHLYLTEPFIASWSMVNAMSCGAVLIASDQTCVREYVVPGENGLLVDFFDHQALADKALSVLADPDAFRSLANAAMRTVQEKFSLDVAIPRIKDLFERVAAHPRQPSTRLEKLMKTGTLKVITSDPEALARKAKLSELPSATTPEVAVPPSVPENAPPQEKAIAMIRQIGFKARTVPDWVRTVQTFRGPPGDFESLGFANHPVDLERLLRRVAEWRPAIVVEVGVREGGTFFLFCQMAKDDGRAVAVATSNSPIPEWRIPFLKAMARPRQSVEIVPKTNDPESIADEVKKATENREIDFLFLHGRRPYAQLAADYRTLRKLVRPGGLISWDGINPISSFPPDRDGGHRLWHEVQSLFPQRAEYLNGSTTEFGGIAVIKL